MSTRNKKPLISIIVPVFQVEKYLEKCISSIIAQTYKNLEIILVDDGSTDNCPAICDRFQVEDSRIKVIHQINGGLSHARNVGLEHATGDFIGFVDSDDWIEPNMYEVLMSALQETVADIAVCGRQMEFEDSQPVPIKIKSQRKLYSSEEALRMLFKGEDFINISVWNKLYRKTILLNIFFQKGKIYEDVLWSPKVIGNARLLVSINYPLYHYLYRYESLSHNDILFIRKFQDSIEMYTQMLEYIHRYHSALERLAIIKFQNLCCMEYLKISINKHQFDSNGNIRKEYYRLFCQLGISNIFDISNISKTLGRMLFWISPSLFQKTYLFYKKIIQNL